ncbi:MAG: hypothetical protein GX452_04170 [Ignavibacteriales bacterium]|jgi:hypothetical protein|nr:hypothetical protein [Ignavibacteriaceae bacterium]NLH60581.1 hypothetical protein [Ignavibacteriales bacterium]HOJ17440.1 hypothetical protein [Ignavibacteriaceae bacterium]HPO54728.1 hypothetical protein [Ignavibacteriaceae bacterium]
MKKVILLILVISGLTYSQDQKIGFGCLGLVGGSAAYQWQKYVPTGFNGYIQNLNKIHKDSLINPMSEFGQAAGYRFGINFFRQNYSGFVITFKGSYQTMLEKQEAVWHAGMGDNANTLDLTINQFSVGFDLGTTIFSTLDWKVIDASVLLTTAKLVHTENYPGKQTIKKEYSSDGNSIGYSFGSGFIFHLIKNYISIEGTLGYAFFAVDKMKLNDSDTFLTTGSSTSPVTNFIENGGLMGIIQINIGFPL